MASLLHTIAASQVQSFENQSKEEINNSVGVGCYRIDLHPRVSGQGISIAALRPYDPKLLEKFQSLLAGQGVELSWPSLIPV
jgi:hypothetical protein